MLVLIMLYVQPNFFYFLVTDKFIDFINLPVLINLIIKLPVLFIVMYESSYNNLEAVCLGMPNKMTF